MDRNRRNMRNTSGRTDFERPGRRPGNTYPQRQAPSNRNNPRNRHSSYTKGRKAFDYADLNANRRSYPKVKQPIYTGRPKNPARSILPLILLIALILLVILAFAMCSKERDPSIDQAGQSEAAAPEAIEPVSLKVTFAGDCTLGTDSSFDPSTSFNAKYSSVGDPSWFMANVEPLFADDDLSVVNFEGTLTESKDRQDKTFAFKGSSDYAKVLSTSSIEAASVANNHSYDYGQQSYDDTLVALDAEGIDVFGYDRISYLDIKGVKVALIGINALTKQDESIDDVERLVAEAKDNSAQLTLVYFHWGVERDIVPNATQIKLAHGAIDAGADAVIGSHPHVIQGWEVYEGRYIAYSLGNFCFGGNSNPRDKDCMVFQQTFTIVGDEVEKNDDVDFIACSISSDPSYNNYQPTIASGSEKERIDKKIQDSTDRIAALATSV